MRRESLIESHVRPRRDFLKTAAAAALATGAASSATRLPAAPATATAATTAPSPRDAFTYGDTGTRLTVAMWDYSWLYDGGPGGAFADLDRCVAGARERGFNTLRVDVFVAQQLEKETRFEQNWKGGLPRWGMTRSAFVCNVRERVAELARACRKHGIWLGLDSWKTVPDSAAATAEKLDGVLAAFGEQ